MPGYGFGEYGEGTFGGTNAEEEPMPGSILEDTKNAIGVGVDASPFDAELILHINAALSDLHQLGVGPDVGFEITGPSQTWDELLANDHRLNNVKQYVATAVRLKFDPPDTGYVVTAIEKQLEKMEWRIVVASDEIRNPVTPDELPEEGVLDGGVI